MSHDHHHHHGTGNISVAFFLNLGFTIIEIIGGFWTNSLAILSDALHDLGDSMSLGLAWYFEKLSRKGRDETFSYGYGRFSLLGAVINSIVLIVGTVFILSQAIPQLINPGNADPKGMLVLALLGIVVNGLAVIRLRKGKTLNEEVVSLHLLEDVLGWVAVLVGSVVMIFFDLPIIDPLLSIGISLFILYNVYRNLKKSLTIILQGTPNDLDVDRISTLLLSISEVKEVHDCHSWSMDGQYNVLTIHLVMDRDYPLSTLATIKQKAKDLLKDQSIDHITIEFETEDENCDQEDCLRAESTQRT